MTVSRVLGAGSLVSGSVGSSRGGPVVDKKTPRFKGDGSVSSVSSHAPVRGWSGSCLRCSVLTAERVSAGIRSTSHVNPIVLLTFSPGHSDLQRLSSHRGHTDTSGWDSRGGPGTTGSPGSSVHPDRLLSFVGDGVGLLCRTEVGVVDVDRCRPRCRPFPRGRRERKPTRGPESSRDGRGETDLDAGV